jgi:hypothetical protein
MTDTTQTMIDEFLAAGASGLAGFEPGGAEWAMPTPESFARVGRIMEEANGMLAARRMQNQAITLRTVAEAMDADLALSPIVIATGPGVGTHTLLKDLATALGLGFADIRCGMIQPHEMVPTGVDGEHLVLAASEMPEAIIQGRPTLVMIDEAVAFGTKVPAALLRQLATAARAPLIVALVVRRDQLDEALDAVGQGTAIERPLIPVAELSFDPRTAMPAQRVRVVGSLTIHGSRRGERYLEIQSTDLPQTTHFTLYAKEGQDDDDLADALGPLFSVSVEVAATLAMDDGALRCTTDDIVAL